jgi:nicotinate-nucleotide--dimethylbenzimidazole phosphoribosyltransferase
VGKIEQTTAHIRALDRAAMLAAQQRQDSLTKPPGSLGRLEEIAVRVAGIMRRPDPEIHDKVMIVFAADHGVVAEGVNLFPQAVTAQMVANFLAGGAAINVLTRHFGGRVVVVDMGVASDYEKPPELSQRQVGPGTANMAVGPAMTRAQAETAVVTGIEIAEREISRGLDGLGIGEMGIGNTTAASAITSVITGAPAAEVTGRGTGLDEARVKHKASVVERALAVNNPVPSDALDVLSKVGGFEIGAMTGAVLAAAAAGRPIVVDGFIATSAALLAATLCPSSKQYMIGAHRSAERGHQRALEYLELDPLLDLGMRLGEGSGAAAALSLVQAACRVLTEMASFDEAGVSSVS